MNLYNDNLRQCVMETLSSLAVEGERLDAMKVSAEMTHYFAQGAELNMRDKLEQLVARVGDWRSRLDDCESARNQIVNLHAVASNANAETRQLTVNVAIAAANVQIAAKAITSLAADLGAAMSIVSAGDSGSAVQEAVAQANKCVCEVAWVAERLAKDGMSASMVAAEISAADLIAQTHVVRTQVEDMYRAAQAVYADISNQREAEYERVDMHSKLSQAAQLCTSAATFVSANNQAYGDACAQLNLGLGIRVLSASEIELSFVGWSQPFAGFGAADAQASAVPAAAPKYHLLLLPAADQSTFTRENAEQLFGAKAADDELSFMPVQPQSAGLVKLSKDVYGQPICAGSRYVACLYVEFSPGYKRFINDFSDWLSAPSKAFVLATKLSSPAGFETVYAKPKGGLSWAKLQFKPDVEAANLAHVEFRCLLIAQGLGTSASSPVAGQEGDGVIVFNQTIAELLSPPNYCKAVLRRSPKGSFEFVFGPQTCDNFGSPIKPDVEYTLYVLSVGTGEAASQFVNALAGPFAPVVVCRSHAQAAKSSQPHADLAQANVNDEAVQPLLNQASELANSLRNLRALSGNTKQQADKACKATTALARDAATLINKLIFSVEVIDKSAQLVSRQKALNPLIADDLVILMAKAGSDANKAVALSMTALSSCYAALSPSLETRQALDLLNTQITSLNLAGLSQKG